MGTAAFEQAWNEAPEPKRGLARAPAQDRTTFDSLWNEQLSPDAKKRLRRQEFQLDVRLPSESTRALPHNRPDRSTTFAGMPEDLGDVALGTLASAPQVIPGMEAVQAFARSLYHREPYGESLRAIRGATDMVPGPAKLAAQAPAAIATGSALTKIPKIGVMLVSPAKAGAVIGAADQALDADPAIGLGERALRTLVGGAGGAAIGKGSEMLATGARVGSSPNTAQTLQRLDDARSASAGPLYDRALKVEGATADLTRPMWQSVLKRPEVSEVVAGLKQMDEFANIDANSPAMLDAVYKVFSDRKGLLAKRLDAVSPNKVNLGRFEKQQVASIQDAILNAADDAGMPTYRAAVRDFAEGSARLKGAERGHDAIRSRLNRNLPMAKSLKNTAPESYEKFLQRTGGAVAREAEQGILGGTKAAFGQSVRKSGLPALSEAPELLRLTKSPHQLAQDRALRALLLAAGAQ